MQAADGCSNRLGNSRAYAGLQTVHASVTLANYRAGHCSRVQMATDAVQSWTGPGDSWPEFAARRLHVPTNGCW